MRDIRIQEIKRNRAGLTLVEMMISLSIFGVVMAVIFGFLTGTRSTYDQTREKVQYQQSVRAVISLMTREIRSAGCDPADAGFDGFSVADDDNFRCRSDLNGDGDVTDLSPDEDVIYTFLAGDLTRNNGDDAYVILRGLTNLTFTYLDADGNVLGATPLNAADRDLIRFVHINIMGQTDDGQPVDYETRILVRNG